MLLRDSRPAESMYCVLEQDTLSAAKYWFNTGRTNKHPKLAFYHLPEFIASKRDVPGRIAQSVMCLATDASLTANPEVTSSITAQSHTFVEIDHDINFTVVLLPSAESFKKGCCQLQVKVCAQVLVNCLSQLAQEKCG